MMASYLKRVPGACQHNDSRESLYMGDEETSSFSRRCEDARCVLLLHLRNRWNFTPTVKMFLNICCTLRHLLYKSVLNFCICIQQKDLAYVYTYQSIQKVILSLSMPLSACTSCVLVFNLQVAWDILIKFWYMVANNSDHSPYTGLFWKLVIAITVLSEVV